MGKDRRARRRRRRARPRLAQRSPVRPMVSSTCSCRRYRSVPVPVPERAAPGRALRVPDPQALGGAVDLTIIDVEANGYRLRLVDHPAAFDRDGMYGPPGGGDFADNPWRFGLSLSGCARDAADRVRSAGRRHPSPRLARLVPAAIFRDRWYADDAVLGGAAMVLTLHNLAYHGWTPREALDQLGLRPGDGVVPSDARTESTCSRRGSSGSRWRTPSAPVTRGNR